MNTQPLISIIIPIYNTEKYLTSCIDSVLSQTYTNIEVILVNDGSKDSSGKICDIYKSQDTRIKVIHLENGGVSRARNIGINTCTGDYLCFIDADDTITSDYIDNFVNAIEEKIKIYIQEIRIIRQDGSVNLVVYKQTGTQRIDKIFSINNLCKHGYVACKMYNTSLIKDNKINFRQDIRFSEDLLFILECLLYTDKIKYIEKTGYNYFLREGNASSKKYSLETEYKCWKTYFSLINELSQKYHINIIKNTNVAEIYSMLFARVRNALYSQRIKTAVRIGIYNDLTKTEKEILCKYKYISNRAVQIGYIFFKFNLPSIVDIYFSIIYKLKKQVK